METSAIMAAGAPLNLVFSIDDGKLQARGKVVRVDPGNGLAIQFDDMHRENREKIPRILEFAQNTTAFYNNHYLENFLRR